MENRQIWLKPKPTHIDEYFEDFLEYLKSSASTPDALYLESLRLLTERVDILIRERNNTPIYRQNKVTGTLQFNTRLCGAWLLATPSASMQKRKQVLLTMINNLLYLSLQGKVTALGQCSYAYNNIPNLIKMAIKLATHNPPETLTFTWRHLIEFQMDQFIMNFLNMECTTTSDGFYEGKGLMAATKGDVELATFSKDIYETKYLQNSIVKTLFLSEYGFKVCSNNDLQIKDSQKDDIGIVEEFVDGILQEMKTVKRTTAEKRLRRYSDGECVPVEVAECTSQRITLKTIDPSYSPITGPLVFEQDLKLFSKVYPVEEWAKVLKVGDRFNVKVNTENNSFSLTDLFVDYIKNKVSEAEVFDAHNNKVPGVRIKWYEFWTDAGFMVYVDLTEEEDKELDEHSRYAGVEITHCGEGQFHGCLYGRICDYEVESQNFSRETVRPLMLKSFIAEHSNIKLLEEKEYERIDPEFIKEYCNTLNVLQRRETNPMIRYRILSVMRILCTLIEKENDDQYCQYIAKYIKTLILFAQAGSNEGNTVITIDTPEDLKDEETVTNGADILNILSCFAKGYDETSSILDPYIDSENETLSKTASLVQSYNRLCSLLDSKTLKGIKKQILYHLSVVTDGDSTLELSNELEGLFGEEDDMKEFKTSFFEAPANAKEQRQFCNIFRGICAMMNNRGGVLYLGVDDRGVPVGVKNDLNYISKRYNLSPTLDAYMLKISQMGEEWFGETCWKYVTLKPISEHNVVSIVVEPYPYDIVYLKDGQTYLRKNNASAPITDSSTIEDIRRRRLENLRKTDDKIIIIQDAIQKERKVRLIGYKSSNSGTIQNRVVEAFHIDNNEYIHCYEHEHGKVKMFRISRAERIVMLDDRWEFKDKHKKMSIDPFHMSGDQKIEVKLRLKLPAKNAIEEYYPGLSQCIKQDNEKRWILTTFTYNLYPLMQFYLSHAQYVEILDVKGLKEAVMDYVKQNILKD